VNREKELPMPKIYYASRTHSQLSQSVNEIKNTKYKPIVSVLGSRDQLCIKPEFKSSQSGSKTSLCKVAVKKQQCQFYHGHEDPLNLSQLKQEILDIEDLVKFGETRKACPYYMNQKIHQDADIIFLPYNYIIDPVSRKSQNIDLNNAIVIFDEGHNIESSCCEISSFELSVSDLEQARKELETCARFLSDGNERDIVPLSRMDVQDLINNLDNFTQAVRNLNLTKENDLTKPGTFIYDLFVSMNVNLDTSVKMMQTIDWTVELLSSRSRSNSRYKVSLINDALKVLFSSPIIHDPQLLQFYRVYIIKKDVVSQERGVPKKMNDIIINFWCFSSAIAMREVASCGTRSIILASGTLSPLEEFAQELGLSFPNRIENSHVIKPEQLLMGVVPKGPNSITLTSTFNRRDSNQYTSDLGYAIAEICKSTPDGVLCFFTSYGIMESMIDKWKKTAGTSIWSLIVQQKDPFIEPKSKQDFSDAFALYEQSIHRGRGAIFFAVCRGKASEGIDFSNSKARAVIICGIPFPALKDPKVNLKKKIMNDHGRVRKLGDEWYSLQAYRAVNQAIGRVIRHRNDFGAVLLCDERFGQPRSKSQLSKWVQPFMKPFPQFNEMIKQLSLFYKKIGTTTNFHEQDPLLRYQEIHRTEPIVFKQNQSRNVTAFGNQRGNDPLAFGGKRERQPSNEQKFLRVRQTSTESLINDPLVVKKHKFVSTVKQDDPLAVKPTDTTDSLKETKVQPAVPEPLSKHDKENQLITAYLKKV
jgi:regulator of telomere elongation helicase 1